MNARNIPQYVFWFVVALFAVGFISRLAPLFDVDGRLLQQFVTEDGYLMLTIARNLSLGLGMSTSDGTIPTNGTQPFVTFVFALGYLLVDSHKVYGVYFAHVFQLLISCLGGYVFYRLATRVYDYSSFNKLAALVLSACFFASPHILPHSMNFLETGTYMLAIMIVLLFFIENDDEAKQVWSSKKALTFGLLLGWLFWVRIDSVFIIFAICIGYLYRGLPLGVENLKARFVNTLIFGTTSVLIACPWLANNYFRFGALTPISGQAQSRESFGQNMDVVPSILTEYLSVFLPIPRSLESNFAVMIVGIVVTIVALVVLFRMFKRSSQRNRTLIVVGLICSVCYIAYYGLLFGAQHFMARYMAALATFLALFTGACVLYIYEHWARSYSKLTIAFSLVVLVLITSLNYRLYSKGVPHQHYYVVNYVQEHVPEDTWIGATQTGTLGYFHDRTINLDGKVNPEALAARQGRKYCDETLHKNQNKPADCLMNYIVQRELWYLVDWVGLEMWAGIPPMDQYFTIEVVDKEKNLTVLKRKNAPELSQPREQLM